MAVNFTAADRVGVVGGYIGGIGQLLGMLPGTTGGTAAAQMCSENTPVTRYELAQEGKIAELRSERDALVLGKETDGKILDLYKAMDQQYRALSQEFAQLAANQAVINQKVTDNLAFVDSKIDAAKKEMLCYVNATFVPGKLVMPLDSICPPAQAAAGTATTPAA